MSLIVVLKAEKNIQRFCRPRYKYLNFNADESSLSYHVIFITIYIGPRYQAKGNPCTILLLKKKSELKGMRLCTSYMYNHVKAAVLVLMFSLHVGPSWLQIMNTAMIWSVQKYPCNLIFYNKKPLSSFLIHPQPLWIQMCEADVSCHATQTLVRLLDDLGLS